MGQKPTYGRCDRNADGSLDIADAITVLSFLFSGGPGSRSCVVSTDPLGCVTYPFCP